MRVVDTDRTTGNGGTDTVIIYEMHVTSAGSLGDLPPEVTITEPIDETTIEVGTQLTFSATVTDEDENLANKVSWKVDDGPLSTPSASFNAMLAEGPHVVTASVMDSAEQSGSDSVSVLVLPLDTTSPTITAPADVVAEANGPLTVVTLGTPVVWDAIDLSPSFSNNAPAGFPVGVTVVTWTATDASGNSASDTQTVTVNPGAGLTVTDIDSISRGSLPGGATLRLTGTGFVDPSTVTFVNGSGPTPNASNVTWDNAETLWVDVSGKSGPRKARSFDVVVTSPGGASAVCPGCLTIIP